MVKAELSGKLFTFRFNETYALGYKAELSGKRSLCASMKCMPLGHN